MGKSTCAAIIGRQMPADVMTTDTLARHPGRPWPRDRIPPHVAEHYRSLSPADLLASVLAHYRDVIWPMAVEMIEDHVAAPDAGVLVLEGSALLPELVLTLDCDAIAAVWLVGDDEVVRARMRTEAGYSKADADQRRLIDSFFARNRLMNALIAETALGHGLPVVEASGGRDAAETAQLCLETLSAPAKPG